MQAVNQALDRLEAGFRVQREFTADAAHELRTPLTILRSRVDTLADRGVSKALHQDIEGMARLLIDEGKQGLRYHGLARPGVAEAEAVARGLLFSRVTGSPVYFVHLSTPMAVDLVAEARRCGVRAIAETCPHYLVLDDSRYEEPDAARYLMTPPLRDARSQAQLWERVQRGDVQSIGSDHCGFSLADREGIDDFTRVSPGIPGVETSLLLLYSFGVLANRLTLPDLIRLLSANPARIFGLWPRKGDLAPGFDADILIFDPRPQRVLSAAELHSRAGFSPYEGLTVTGRVSTTIVRGQVVYQNGKVVGKPDFGRFQASEPFDPAAAML